jgi:hypothetical protein
MSSGIYTINITKHCFIQSLRLPTEITDFDQNQHNNRYTRFYQAILSFPVGPILRDSLLKGQNELFMYVVKAIHLNMSYKYYITFVPLVFLSDVRHLCQLCVK